jgi:hypothetical protein
MIINQCEFLFLGELNEIFSRFKDDPEADFININSLTSVLQAFGRNPSLRDSEQRIIELEEVGKQRENRIALRFTGREFITSKRKKSIFFIPCTSFILEIYSEAKTSIW